MSIRNSTRQQQTTIFNGNAFKEVLHSDKLSGNLTVKYSNGDRYKGKIHESSRFFVKSY